MTNHVLLCRAHAIGCAAQDIAATLIKAQQPDPLRAGDEYLSSNTVPCLCHTPITAERAAAVTIGIRELRRAGQAPAPDRLVGLRPVRERVTRWSVLVTADNLDAVAYAMTAAGAYTRVERPDTQEPYIVHWTDGHGLTIRPDQFVVFTDNGHVEVFATREDLEASYADATTSREYGIGYAGVIGADSYRREPMAGIGVLEYLATPAMRRAGAHVVARDCTPWFPVDPEKEGIL